MALTLDGTVGLKQSLPFMISQVCFFAGNTAPTGFLACSGQLISRTTYASLFAIIGTTYGAGDGSTTFALPDLRGEFIRGWDNGRGVDTGRGFASAQAGDNASHTHSASSDTHAGHTHSYNQPAAGAIAGYGTQGNGNYWSSAAATSGSSGAHSHVITVTATGGTETRPRNVALLACIFTGV